MGKSAHASTKQLFVNWIGYHGRSDDLASNLDAQDIYVTGGAGNRLIRYVRQWRDTVRAVRRERPDVVYVMQPPIFALWATKVAAPRSCTVIADLHTGVFTDPKWRWAWKWILAGQRRRGNAVIVTNESLAKKCRARGVRTFVLDDAVPRRVGKANAVAGDAHLRDLRPDEYVLVPLAYAADEPLDEILGAAAQDVERTWVLTGRAPASVRANAPRNVVFSGFVTREDYEWLAAHAGVMLACTTEEETMQRAGYEAVSWERPLVTTRTRVLLDYFGDAAVFTDPIASSLADSMRTAFKQRAELIRATAALGELKRKQYEFALEELREFAGLKGAEH